MNKYKKAPFIIVLSLFFLTFVALVIAYKILGNKPQPSREISSSDILPSSYYVKMPYRLDQKENFEGLFNAAQCLVFNTPYDRVEMDCSNGSYNMQLKIVTPESLTVKKCQELSGKENYWYVVKSSTFPELTYIVDAVTGELLCNY